MQVLAHIGHVIVRESYACPKLQSLIHKVHLLCVREGLLSVLSESCVLSALKPHMWVLRCLAHDLVQGRGEFRVQQ